MKAQLQKLKDKYSSDIQNLAVPAQELHENSHLAFSKVNSEISKHSSAFMDVSKDTSFSQCYFLSTLSSINFACILVQLVGKISADVNAILNGLQGNIRELEVKINAFVRQEQQVHKHATNFLSDTLSFVHLILFISLHHQYQTRRYQEIQKNSEVLLNFFKTLNTYVSKLRLMDEKSQSINDQQLCVLEEKFEVFICCSGPSLEIKMSILVSFHRLS